MDFDSDDFLLLNCSYNDDETIDNYISFDCTETGLMSKSGFLCKSDVGKLVQFSNANDLNNTENEFDFMYGIEILKGLCLKQRMLIQRLKSTVKSSVNSIPKNDIPNVRKEITTLLYNIRNASRVYDAVELREIMEPIISTLDPFNIMSDHILKSSSNKHCIAEYHLIHGHLDWRWLSLTIYYKFANELEFENLLKFHILDLISVSAKQFNLTNFVELQTTEATMPCLCFREYFILIQILMEKRGMAFWPYINECLKIYGESKALISQSVMIKMIRNSRDIPCRNYYHFAIWFVCEILQSQCYNASGQYLGDKCARISENFDFVEQLTQAYLNSKPEEQELRIYMLILIRILNCWPPKIEIVMTFWNYYHKLLNSVFGIRGSLGLQNEETVSGISFLSSTKSMIYDIKGPRIITPSYNIFLTMLSSTIRRLNSLGHLKQINKILGRVYTNLPQSKLMLLNERGIHHVGMLFIVLALETDIQYVGLRICEVLLTINIEKLSESRAAVIIKTHLALMLLFLEKGVSIEGYVIKMLTQVNARLNIRLKTDEDSLTNFSSALKIIVNSFEAFYLEHTTDIDLELGGHLIYDTWVIRYMKLAATSEIDRFFKVTNDILNKFQNNCSKNVLLLKSTIFNLIVPFFKSKSNKLESLINLPPLAANLCLSAQPPHKFIELFKFFVESLLVEHTRETVQIWNIIISTAKVGEIDNEFTIKNWMKCCLFTNKYNDDLKVFTRHVYQLHEMDVLIGPSKLLINNSNYPLHDFFQSIGKHFKSLPEQSAAQVNICEKMRSYLTDFDKTIDIFMNQTNCDVVAIYKMIAQLIFHCSQAIYYRFGPHCFFNTVFSKYITPSLILMGRTPESSIINSIHQTWSLLIGGISKIDFENDEQVKGYLNALFIKWPPHFKAISKNAETLARPFVEVAKLCPCNIVTRMYEQFMTNFIVLHQRQSHPLSCYIVTILIEIFKAIKDDGEKMALLLRTTILDLLEHAMKSDDIVPSKRMILELLEAIFKSLTYRASDELKEILVNGFKQLTTKNLSYYSVFFFSFLQKCLKINPLLVHSLMDHICEEIKKLEKIREIRDEHLRRSYMVLEKSLMASVKK